MTSRYPANSYRIISSPRGMNVDSYFANWHKKWYYSLGKRSSSIIVRTYFITFAKTYTVRIIIYFICCVKNVIMHKRVFRFEIDFTTICMNTKCWRPYVQCSFINYYNRLVILKSKYIYIYVIYRLLQHYHIVVVVVVVDIVIIIFSPVNCAKALFVSWK